MVTYVSILRGINVSGQKKIVMKDLKVLFEELNFKNVRTYIQSGNIIFEFAKINNKRLSELIGTKIFEKYKFNVPVLVLNVSELNRIMEKNPFVKEKGIKKEKLHVTFLDKDPRQTNKDDLKDVNFEPDKFSISGNAVYVYCPNGYGRTKLNNNFFENKLKVTATTRNWNTVNELFKMTNF
jgi:uncharacterized protein (DUF1697 family)